MIFLVILSILVFMFVMSLVVASLDSKYAFNKEAKDFTDKPSKEGFYEYVNMMRNLINNSTKKDLTIREMLVKYENGEFNTNDIDVAFELGWSIYVDDKSEIPYKSKFLIEKIKEVLELSETKKFDIDNHYIAFSKEIPSSDEKSKHYYSKIMIFNKSTDVLIYTIIPTKPVYNNSEFVKTISEVWSRENDFNAPVISGSWVDVLNYFNN